MTSFASSLLASILVYLTVLLAVIPYAALGGRMPEGVSLEMVWDVISVPMVSGPAILAYATALFMVKIVASPIAHAVTRLTPPRNVKVALEPCGKAVLMSSAKTPLLAEATAALSSAVTTAQPPLPRHTKALFESLTASLDEAEGTPVEEMIHRLCLDLAERPPRTEAQCNSLSERLASTRQDIKKWRTSAQETSDKLVVEPSEALLDDIERALQADSGTPASAKQSDHHGD